jgi:uncharacterized protein (DUF1501 family)
MSFKMTRRIFLCGSTLALAGFGRVPHWLARATATASSEAQRKKVLVAIFLRGAADGLNIIVPFGEKAYYLLRPTIAIPKPDKRAREDSCIDLDGFFGLHPSLASLKPIYDVQQLAIVHAAGSPDPTRSHFDAQDFMESATPGFRATADGWLNRALPLAEGKTSPVRAIALSPALPLSLRGHNDAVAIGSIDDFQIQNAAEESIFESMYDHSSDRLQRETGHATFEAIKILKSVQKRPYQPARGVQYPQDLFGDKLQQIARLIKADLGIEAAFADVGGWDHHINEVGAQASKGILADALRNLADALAAFYLDLGDRMEDVAVVTMSEFGRTARENGNRGTDHGHANIMFVMGGKVRGGRIYGQWPGLEKKRLYEGRDLAITTDFRDVLGELVCMHLGNRNLTAVFPGYEISPKRFKGFIKS